VPFSKVRVAASRRVIIELPSSGCAELSDARNVEYFLAEEKEVNSSALFVAQIS